ncbi:MAG: isoprenylcysteine carboxylmethyltransferase family protein [Saprospiraceae bacterium]|nr:isoprenylcysteine carboxylmethyltransferase family protein [Saprospiraceae bacterium]
MSTSLYFRNLFFIIVQPGLVTLLIPYLLYKKFEIPVQDFEIKPLPILLFFLFIAGFAILLHCVYRFIHQGIGTLSPLDPTKHLVTKGLYAYSRNPMYIGVMAMLIAESFYFRSSLLGCYTLCIFLLFNAFILLHEEPRLQKVFGSDYQKYKAKVRRWL